MVKEIKLKTDNKFFEKILNGEKKFELRLGDKGISEGDFLVLLEKNSEGNLTGREIRKEVKTVVRTKELNHWNEDQVDKFGFIVAGFD